MPSTRSARCLLPLASLLAVSCLGPTEEHLIEAAAALDACDLRQAHRSFDAAYASNPANGTAALGFALTDTIFLAEDPEITAALAEFGFTAPIDTERLWGADGLLARLESGDSCESVSDYAQGILPYPPLRDSSVDFFDVIEPDLRSADTIAHLTALDGRLARLAQAFETAASAMDGSTELSLEGGCGGGNLAVQAPELFAGATLFTLLRAIIALAPTYDWSMVVSHLFGGETSDRVAALQTLLTVVNAGAAENARAHLLSAIELGDRGLAAAEAIRAPVPNAAFDWSSLNRTFISDMRLFAERAISSLSERRAVDIPRTTPPIGINLSLFLTDPPDQASLPEPLWHDDGGYLQGRSSSFEGLLRPYFTPDPFGDGTRLSFDVSDGRWDIDLGQLVNPDERWSGVYSCGG